jgi:hypothetical protein
MRGGALTDADFPNIQKSYICNSQKIGDSTNPGSLATELGKYTIVNGSNLAAAEATAMGVGKDLHGLYKMNISSHNVYFKVDKTKKPPNGIWAYLT